MSEFTTQPKITNGSCDNVCSTCSLRAAFPKHCLANGRAIETISYTDCDERTYHTQKIPARVNASRNGTIHA